MASELTISSDIVARLDDPGWQTFDADVPTTPPGAYLIVWPDPGTVTAGRLGYRPVDLLAEWRVVCCGRSRAQVLDLVAAVRDRLVGWRPYLDRGSGPVVEVPTSAILLSDRAAGETRFSLTLTFRLATTRS